MDEQQRKEMRVSVDIDIEVNQIVVSEYPVVLPKILAMKILNISVGGVLLFSSLDLTLGLYFCSTIVFGGEQMNIVCEDIRKEEQQDGYYYGCKFRGLTLCEQQVIRKFVFQEQMRSRKLRCANAN